MKELVNAGRNSRSLADVALIVALGGDQLRPIVCTSVRKLYRRSQIRSLKVRSYLFAIETCLERSRENARDYGTKITDCTTDGLAGQWHHAAREGI
jgi:hypothetical protein